MTIITGTIENVEKVVECAICLHNFIRLTGNQQLCGEYIPLNFVDQEIDGEIIEGEWRQMIDQQNAGIVNGQRMGSRNATTKTLQQRNSLKDFVNEYSVLPYQDRIVQVRIGGINEE